MKRVVLALVMGIVVAGAAFARYAREATDYTTGRRIVEPPEGMREN